MVFGLRTFLSIVFSIIHFSTSLYLILWIQENQAPEKHMIYTIWQYISHISVPKKNLMRICDLETTLYGNLQHFHRKSFMNVRDQRNGESGLRGQNRDQNLIVN